VLCGGFLTSKETDLCHKCRADAPKYTKSKRKIPLIAQWTAVWYYKGNVRQSIHRFKFANARRYADVYARQMAVSIIQAGFADNFDCITWVPISFLRYLKRGYNQSALMAKALSKEFGIPAIRLLKKVRHTPAQSGIQGGAQRKANIVNAYAITDAEKLRGRKVLLIDDVLTTGATVSECAKTLAAGGVSRLYFAAVATSEKNK
jgi:ComF family protein